MKFVINPNKTKTEPQYFKTGETALKMIPFNSEIKGLMMHLQLANGSNCTFNIVDTNYLLIKDISSFGYIWFTYTSTDIEYIIELIIN